MTTNWKAMQVPADKVNAKIRVVPHGIKTRYMSAGSWHADLSKEGKCRAPFKSSCRGA